MIWGWPNPISVCLSSPQSPLTEATCCLGNFLSLKVSGNKARQHPHSHHWGCRGPRNSCEPDGAVRGEGCGLTGKQAGLGRG